MISVTIAIHVTASHYNAIFNIPTRITSCLTSDGGNNEAGSGTCNISARLEIVAGRDRSNLLHVTIFFDMLHSISHQKFLQLNMEIKILSNPRTFEPGSTTTVAV